MVWQPWNEGTFRRRKPDKQADGTAVTTSREHAIADALGPKRCAEIHEEAVEEAARIMADWEGRR